HARFQGEEKLVQTARTARLRRYAVREDLGKAIHMNVLSPSRTLARAIHQNPAFLAEDPALPPSVY
ncbi:MAG TPA: hypothetical protein VKE70_37695, partial [Candidatus Solibacter sp.]|nr:hypothetical protein [Candidatus Solibacter sp.]